MRRTCIRTVIVLVLAATLVPLSGSRGVESQQQSALEGWQTYADLAYGYTVRYPPGWVMLPVFENAGREPYVIRRRLAFHDLQDTEIEIDVWHREASMQMDQWFREVENITATVEANAIVGGQESYILVQPGGCGVPPSFSTYVPFGDNVLKLYTQHTGEQRDLDLYGEMLRSFSPAGVNVATEARPMLPELEAMVPLTCDTNICPSTCLRQCTFAPVSEGCCGYHAIPKWQCSKECIGSQIGAFLGNCVWWGAYTRPDVGSLARGDARYWAVTVRNTGQLPVDTTPKMGDIVVHPGSSYNHVAYVVGVSPDGNTYQMSDMGWCSDCGPSPEEAKLRIVDGDNEFIHCKGDPPIPTIDWRFSDCPFGWTPSKGFSFSQLDGSAWNLNPAADPYLLSPILSVRASQYKSLEIHMASHAADTNGRLSFTTASSPAFDETKVVTFTITNDGSMRTYDLDMDGHPDWRGTITRLRIDPVEAGNSDGSFDNVEIARIRFVYVHPTPPAHRIDLPAVLHAGSATPMNRPPYAPSAPLPSDGAVDQPASLTLTWTGGDPDRDDVTYDVYLDARDETPQTLVCGDVPTPTCQPDPLLGGTQYFWQVIASDEHSAVTAGPVWGFNTVPSDCVQIIANGGFEGNADWEIPDTQNPATYTTVQAHAGSRSMRVGFPDPAATEPRYSSARQLVIIPAAAGSATLRFWLYAASGERTSSAVAPAPLLSPEEATLSEDAQYVLVLNEQGDRLETLFWQLRDDMAWTHHEADLSTYAGHTIKLHFGVFNNGQGGVTGMYVDDVSLVACSP